MNDNHESRFDPGAAPNQHEEASDLAEVLRHNRTMLHAIDRAIDDADTNYDERQYLGEVASQLAGTLVEDALDRASSSQPPELEELLVLHRRLDPLDERWMQLHEVALAAELAAKDADNL